MIPMYSRTQVRCILLMCMRALHAFKDGTIVLPLLNEVSPVQGSFLRVSADATVNAQSCLSPRETDLCTMWRTVL